MLLSNGCISSFQATATDLRGDMMSLYSNSVVAGSPFFITITSHEMFASQFYSHYAIAIVGHSRSPTPLSRIATNNTAFTDCTIHPTTESIPESFLLCLRVTVADVYDVTVSFDGEAIAQFPCFGCMTVLYDSPSIANVLLEGLSDEVYTGVTYLFQVWLRDKYNNIIPRSPAYNVSFAPDPNRYIAPNPTSDFPSPHSSVGQSLECYAFALFANHTDVFSFFTYLNGVPVSSTPTTITIIAPNPSDLSHIVLPAASAAVTDRWVDVGAVDRAEA